MFLNLCSEIYYELVYWQTRRRVELCSNFDQIKLLGLSSGVMKDLIICHFLEGMTCK